MDTQFSYASMKVEENHFDCDALVFFRASSLP